MYYQCNIDPLHVSIQRKPGSFQVLTQSMGGKPPLRPGQWTLLIICKTEERF